MLCQWYREIEIVGHKTDSLIAEEVYLSSLLAEVEWGKRETNRERERVQRWREKKQDIFIHTFHFTSRRRRRLCWATRELPSGSIYVL